MMRWSGLVVLGAAIGAVSSVGGCDSTEYQSSNPATPQDAQPFGLDAGGTSSDTGGTNGQTDSGIAFDSGGPADSGGQGDSVALTFELVADAPGTTLTVQSAPAGVACTGSCPKQTVWFTRGSAVSFTTQGSDSYRYSGDCTGTTCTVQMNAPRTVKLRASAFNYMFLSSELVNGAIGGTAGADAKCNKLAADAGLPGNYVAWLATPAAPQPRNRLGAANGWIRPDGKPVLSTSAAFSAWEFRYMPLLDERGARPQPLLWSGIDEYANLASSTCNGFTTASAAATGQVGQADTSDRFWVAGESATCDRLRSLMCVGIDRNAPVAVPVRVAPARRAFLTASTISPSAGLAGFDSLCRTEATNAGLANAANFLALVAPGGGATPASRFNSNGSPWVRTDGVELAATAAAFLNGDREAALTVTAQGILQGETVVISGTAAAYPNDWTTAGGQTCNNWTTSSGGTTYMRGVATRSRQYMGTSYAKSCNGPAALYCLEN
jgi:hypothetical protein